VIEGDVSGVLEQWGDVEAPLTDGCRDFAER
jgi:hypothetical protein